jgi:hypothetical protein
MFRIFLRFTVKKKEKLKNSNNNLNALDNWAKGWMSRLRILVEGNRLVSQISKPPLGSA